MHSFLVSTPPDFPVSPDVFHLYPEKSIGIAEIRQLQSFLTRKPLKLPSNIAIIHEAEKLSLPAQHALLKTLEEPPGASHIYLVTDYPDQLLETILSRVQISESTHKSHTTHMSYPDSLPTFFQKLHSARVGERLELIDSQNFTRDTALDFLAHLESYIHQSLSPSHKVGEGLGVRYNLIFQTRRYLTSNCSVRLCMDLFALSL
jgi:hypothetical protein